MSDQNGENGLDLSDQTVTNSACDDDLNLETSLTKTDKLGKQVITKPLKFKLVSLNNVHLRYEVIYKNLLRDLRKYYIVDFNKNTDYIRKKRRLAPSFYLDCLKAYVVEMKILESPPVDGVLMGTSVESLVFNLGSLIYPKDMIRCCLPDHQEEQAKDLRKDVRDKPLKVRQVIRVYHYLYRFSLQRLNKLVMDPSMVKLFTFYFDN